MKPAPLEPPDTHYVRAAKGWLGLGDFDSANCELDQITPALQFHPEVLQARCDILVKAKQWKSLFPIAETLFRIAPEDADSWIAFSMSLQHAGRLQEAFDLLLAADVKFPKDWWVIYNLTCYATQLGRLEASRQWLERTLALGGAGKLKREALTDPDLEPLWPTIEAIPAEPISKTGNPAPMPVRRALP